jgi:tetratricopeptide (TPR) repeat protein
MNALSPSRDADVLRALAERIDRNDPDAFNNLGVLYHSKGMYAEAVDALLHAISLDPRMQTAMRNLEVAAAQTGACDVILANLAAHVAADPDDRESARAQARLLRLIGRHVEAAHMFDALIAEDPDDSQALLERGLLEQRAGDLRRAQRWFERATNADASNAIARLQLAEVMYQRGLNDQSLIVLNVLLEQDAEFADAHLLLGFVLGDMGQHEAGMQAARRAASLKPALATVQPNLSLEHAVEAAVGAPSHGIENEGVLRVIASGEMARYGLGMAFRQRGYFVEARQEFVRALAAGEEDRLVRHAIAELDLLAGHTDVAVQAYTALIEQYGDLARWHNELGVALHQGGQAAQAAESYRRALRNDPRYALAYNNLGVALADTGEYSAAREAIQRAVAIDLTLDHARINLERCAHPDASLAHALDVVIELQIECAESAASLELLVYRAARDKEGIDRADARRDSGSHLAVVVGALENVSDDAYGGAIAPAFGALFEPHSVTSTVDSCCADADRFAARGQHHAALELYQALRAETEWSGPAEGWRSAAIGEVRTLCLLGRGAEALGLIERVLHEPSDCANDMPELLALLAAAHGASWIVADGDVRLARAAIAKFLHTESRSAALLHFVGDVAMSINEDALAVVLFRRALAVDPTRPTPRVAIARLLRRRKDVLAARLELVAALAVAPELREALLELAALHSDAKRPAEALPILVSYLQREPQDVEALALLAHTLVQIGRSTDARLALERARRHQPDHPFSVWLEGKLLATSREGAA